MQKIVFLSYYALYYTSGVKKKVEAASKRKNCDVLSRWSQSISNHLYFCASASNGNGEMLVDMWKSLLNHVANIHEGHGSLFPRCQHGPLEEDREWIKKGNKLFSLVLIVDLLLCF